MAIGRAKPVIYNGKEYESRAELCRILKIDQKKFYGKLRYGKNVDIIVAELLEEKALIELGEKPMNEIIDTLKTKDVEPTPEPIKAEQKDPLLSPKSATVYKPKYIQVETVSQLLEVLENFEAKTVNLIDFENLKDEKDILEKYATNEDDINIFFYNALKHSNKFYAFTRNSKGTSIQFFTYECIDQLIDNLIIYFLGALQVKYPEKKYNILTRDTGFYKFAGYLHSENIECLGINYIYNKEARYKYSLCKFIANTKVQHRNTVATHEIGNLFRPFYERDLDQDDIDNLIESLDKFELIEHQTKGSFEWIKFKMPEVYEFVNKYKYES